MIVIRRRQNRAATPPVIVDLESEYPGAVILRAGQERARWDFEHLREEVREEFRAAQRRKGGP